MSSQKVKHSSLMTIALVCAAVVKWKESPLFKIVGTVSDMIFLKGQCGRA
jgi:hypothetical protein